jgi:hypothetical protein
MKMFDNGNSNHFSLNDGFLGFINVSLVRKLHHIIYDLVQRSLTQTLTSHLSSSFRHNLMAAKTSKVSTSFIQWSIRKTDLLNDKLQMYYIKASCCIVASFLYI